MSQKKLSVSVPASLSLLGGVQVGARPKDEKSQVVERALELLREQELEHAYAAASKEVDPAWEVTVGDGLGAEHAAFLIAITVSVSASLPRHYLRQAS